jgi:hypothetical protein
MVTMACHNQQPGRDESSQDTDSGSDTDVEDWEANLDNLEKRLSDDAMEGPQQMVQGVPDPDDTADGARANLREGSQPFVQGVPDLEQFMTIDSDANGYWSWHPPLPKLLGNKHLSDRKVVRSEEHTAKDIKEYTRHRQSEKPGRLVHLQHPVRLFDLPEIKSQWFSFDKPGAIVPLYVAQQRGFDVSTIDFALFGGAILNHLATMGYQPQRVYGEKLHWKGLSEEWFTEVKVNSKGAVMVKRDIANILDGQAARFVCGPQSRSTTHYEKQNVRAKQDVRVKRGQYKCVKNKQYIPNALEQSLRNCHGGYVLTNEGKPFESLDDLRKEWPGSLTGVKSLDFNLVPPVTSQHLSCQKVGNAVVMKLSSGGFCCNLADFGHQYERMITGKPQDGSCHRWGSNEFDATVCRHLHIMQIGQYKVLISAEVDARDDNGLPVEIKTGNPDFFYQKVMWQMVSSGSRTLIQARKDKGTRRMMDHQKCTLADVAKKACANYEVAKSVENIFNAFRKIKASAEINEDGVCDVAFTIHDKLKFTKVEKSILPKRTETAKLLIG